MNVKNVVTDLWKNGFFESCKSIKEVDSKMLKDYGTTCANTSMVLKICKTFLRKDKSGWIQKKRFSEEDDLNSSEPDFFKILKIHPEIEGVSRKLFTDKHYAQAIFEAFKKVNNLVKEKSGRRDLDGKNLMLTTFSVNAPILKMNVLISQSDKDEQEGFMHLYAGAIMGIRNPKGHDNIIQKNKDRTLKYLMFASILCERLEECSKTNT